MAAPTEVYVDPSIAANSGSGTIGDPYGDLQFALNSVTRDSTNGDRFNVKAGTDEILASAALSLATYGTPALNAPITFEGYTSAAGDGGIGGISGGGSLAIYAAGAEHVYWKNLHLHNCGSATILTINHRCGVFNCELNNTSGSGINSNTQSSIISGCNFHDIGTHGILGGFRAFGNYFKNGTKPFVRAINASITNGVVCGNIISVAGSSIAIYMTNGEWDCIANSILSAGGTGQGIIAPSNDEYNGSIFNNLIEGFSGSGGVGIKADGARKLATHGFNAGYNNATNFSITQFAAQLGDNEALGASPFAKSGSDTFANRYNYFAPVDTGGVHGGAYPVGCRLDIGAVQHADPAGGGGGGHLIAGRGGLAGYGY